MDKDRAMEELRESYFRIKKLSILINEFLEEGDPDLLQDEDEEQKQKNTKERQALLKCLRATIKKAQEEFIDLEKEVILPANVEQIIVAVKRILSDLLESLDNYDKALKDLN